ncbi:hypothetical protein KKA69_03790 [Patescibacteria group bacterium]|nr:hypothetical protein [Patescibacteria group bacterium]
MKTKIIATIGPSSLSPSVFNQMADAGMDFIRLNSKYGTHLQYDKVLKDVNNSSKRLKIIFDISELKSLDYFIKNNLEYLALSFTESGEQIEEVKKLVPNAKIISKIESVRGVKNYNKILDFSWGVMIARGDLGEAIPLEQIPCLQKSLAHKAVKKEKFVIVATEMLLSMVESPKPTRAEVSDVANAIYDGASAVMLSEETAIGKYPIESVDFMNKIIKHTESCIF